LISICAEAPLNETRPSSAERRSFFMRDYGRS
jgi:hypothetical protein